VLFAFLEIRKKVWAGPALWKSRVGGRYGSLDHLSMTEVWILDISATVSRPTIAINATFKTTRNLELCIFMRVVQKES